MILQFIIVFNRRATSSYWPLTI